MAKSDFICDNCKQVITHGFFNPFTFKKYKCAACGRVLCDDYVDKPLIGRPKCKACDKKVIAYAFKDNKWTQI